MDHHERDRRDPPDAEEDAPSTPSSAGDQPESDGWNAPTVDDREAPVPPPEPAPAEIESWPSQDATADHAAGTATQGSWPPDPPAASSTDEEAWPTSAPDRGDEPVLEPVSSAPSGPAPSAPPPGEVEAYPAMRVAPADPDHDATGVMAASAAHTVPAGEGAIGESTQCPRCGTENRPGLAFCRNCGQRLVAAGVASTVERPGAPEGTTACPRCGTHNRAGVAFCQNCGANLRGTGPDYVPPAVATEPSAQQVDVDRRGAILGPIVLLIGLLGILTGYVLPFLYGSGSLFERAAGPGGYGVAFWSGYPEVGAGLADQAYYGLAGPVPILGLLLLVLAIAGFMRATPGSLQTVGLGITLLWSVGLIVLFVVVELAGNWTGDLVGMLRVLTPAGIIFLLASLIVLIGTLTRFGRS